MGRFDGGVGYYTKYRLDALFAFPEDVMCCRYCRFIRSDNGGIRYKCVVTDRVIFNFDQPGPDCPMTKETEDHA